jgi:probable F420-dependent oxidoreductase
MEIIKRKDSLCQKKLFVLVLSPPVIHHVQPGLLSHSVSRNWAIPRCFYRMFMGTPLTALTALTVAAAVTTKLRVGGYVFVNDYRHPILLAREIATLDQLSDGRVELGLGAGNWPHEFQQIGIPFDKPGVRVSRLTEAVSIIKQFFAGETVNFSGDYYTTSVWRPVPRPVQQPHPPILIAGSGRRMLTLAAREADIILPTPPDEEKIGWIREAAGERF